MRDEPREPDTWEAYMQRQILRARLLSKPMTDAQYHALERKIMAAIFDEKITATVCCPVCSGEGRISIAPTHNS